MAIPKLNVHGVLPPHQGDPTDRTQTSPYPATTLELCEKFGHTKPRRDILRGYLGLRVLLHQLDVIEGFQWVDGQFLEDVERRTRKAPEHIQVVTFCRLSERCRDREFAHLTATLESPKATLLDYQVDHTPILLSWPPTVLVDHTQHWCGRLSHQKETNAWKGLLRIDLNTPEADEAALHHLAGLERP